jgi:hypothetical protein
MHPMKKVHVMPVIAAVLLAAACGGDDGPTTVEDTQVSVRFVNMTSGMAGNGGFTANGQFVAGSALASGQVAQTCSKLNGGQTSFGFGAANTAGTGLSGNELTTLLNETISAGGDYTLVAAGPAASPTLHLLTNGFSGSLSANQAAVRFMSLAPTTGTTVFNYVFYLGEIGKTSPLALNMPYGITSAYSVVPSGVNTFSALQTPGATTVVPGNTVTLQAGSANTIALVRNASGDFQLIHLPRCS